MKLGSLRSSPWRELGIGPTADAAAIHAAYARKMAERTTMQDPGRLAALMRARDTALALVSSGNPDALGLAQDPATGEDYASALKSRLDVARIWIVSAAALIFALIKVVTFFDASDTDQAPASEVVADNSAQSQAVIAGLFGEAFGPEQLYLENPGVADELVRAGKSAAFSHDPVESARSQLRASMLNSRALLDRDLLGQVARLQLIWLKTAQAEGAGACREVTDRSFYEGVPHLGAADQLEEQAVARAWVQAIERRPSGQDAVPMPALPPALRDQVARDIGLPPEGVGEALANVSDPRRCMVTIALLERLLENPQSASSALLSAI